MLSNVKVWILITGLVVLLSGFALFAVLRSKETDKNIFTAKIQDLTSQIERLSESQTALELNLKQKTEVETKLRNDISVLESQALESKRVETQLKNKIDTLTKEKDAMTKYNENNGMIISKLQKKIESLEKEKKKAVESVQSAASSAFPRYTDPMADDPGTGKGDDRDIEAGAKLADEGIVDLGRIVIRDQTNEAARVEHVNTLYGFIVVSAGTDEGLKKDSVINVTRNNRLIAKAVVKKVRASTASAVTLPEWTREEIRIGDLVSINPMDLPAETRSPFFKRA